MNQFKLSIWGQYFSTVPYFSLPYVVDYLALNFKKQKSRLITEFQRLFNVSSTSRRQLFKFVFMCDLNRSKIKKTNFIFYKRKNIRESSVDCWILWEIKQNERIPDNAISRGCSLNSDMARNLTSRNWKTTEQKRSSGRSQNADSSVDKYVVFVLIIAFFEKTNINHFGAKFHLMLKKGFRVIFSIVVYI